MDNLNKGCLAWFLYLVIYIAISIASYHYFHPSGILEYLGWIVLWQVIFGFVMGASFVVMILWNMFCCDGRDY